MKRISLFVVIIGTLLFVASSCGFASQKRSGQRNAGTVTPSDVPDSSPVSQTGQQIYQQKCVACHQANGLGVAGAFPPLKGSDFLKTEPKKRIIEQVLNGSGGGLVVNNVRYNTSMPPQTDNINEAVAVVNYILNAWGNNYGKVTPEDAKGVKKTNKGGRHMMMRGRMGRMGMNGGGGCNGMRR